LFKKNILVVSSKVFSFAENRLFPEHEYEKLVEQEAEKLIWGPEISLTKKYGMWVAAAEIAVAANLLMGEAAERIPFVIVRGALVEFTDREIDSIKEQSVADEVCIFRPLFKEDL